MRLRKIWPRKGSMYSLCLYLPVSGLAARPLSVSFRKQTTRFRPKFIPLFSWCFHSANRWNTFLLLLRMIAQIGWALSSTLEFFRTILNGRSFSVWQRPLQTTCQKMLQSRTNFPDRHIVTDLRLPILTIRTAGQENLSPRDPTMSRANLLPR